MLHHHLHPTRRNSSSSTGSGSSGAQLPCMCKTGTPARGMMLIMLLPTGVVQRSTTQHQDMNHVQSSNQKHGDGRWPCAAMYSE
jgi:hypothetical protein